jgi:4-hydroxybenzoate polyprenyltransferase
VLTRSAGCAINDYADRNIDGQVARTQNRPLAQKLIAPWEAVALATVLALAAFALVLLALKPLVAKLAVLAAIVAAIYPFMKRFFPMPQAWLGIAFSFGIPMAFAQVVGALPLPKTCWLLMLATWFWIVAYDTEYAMADREDDVKIGVKSSAILFGKYDIAAIVTCYIAFFALLIAVGVINKHGAIYYGGLVIAAVFAVFNLRMIQGREPAKCLAAFKQNNWIGIAVFLGLAFDYLPRAA